MILIVDRKFTPEQLRVRKNQTYVADLLRCVKIFKSWGYDIIWVEEGADALRALKDYGNQIAFVLMEAYLHTSGMTMTRMIRFNPDATTIPVALMSSRFSTADIEEATKVGAAECLPKPFNDPDQLQLKLMAMRGASGKEPSGGGESTDRVGHILRELERIDDLPVMAPVFSEIERLSRTPDATTEEYREVIELDVSITAQLLRLSNSSAFGFSREVTSVSDSINLLGIKTVVNVVRTLSVMGSFKKHSQPVFDANEFWKHAIACGVVARNLAGLSEIKLDLGDADPFMAGMVHDIGKMVFGYYFADLFKIVSNMVQNNGRSMYAIEKDILGINHAEVGAALATPWKLPETMIKVIGEHHEPNEDANPMTVLIHAADATSRSMGFAFKEPTQELIVSESALGHLGIDLPAFSTLVSQIDGDVRTQVADTHKRLL